MKRTIVVAAFPGCGKSYMFNNHNGEKYTMLDSDSSKFSWIENLKGKDKKRNPAFPKNYIEHIKENIGKVDVIFVSTHDTVLDALYEANIPCFIVKPSIDMLDNFVSRYKLRGNDESFISFITSNWESFITSIDNRSSVMCNIYTLTKDNPYITNDILDMFFNISSTIFTQKKHIMAFKLGVDNIPDWFMDRVSSNEITLTQERRIGGATTCSFVDVHHDNRLVKVLQGDYVVLLPDNTITSFDSKYFEMMYCAK